MSRTRKTRPLHVRMADPKDNGVGIEEIHNHINGRECDLPVHADPKNIEETYPLVYSSKPEERPCYYHFKYTGKNLCGCDMCTDREFHNHENRAERHHTKEKLKDIRKHHDYFDDEV